MRAYASDVTEIQRHIVHKVCTIEIIVRGRCTLTGVVVRTQTTGLVFRPTFPVLTATTRLQ